MGPVFLAKVRGTVVASVRTPGLDGVKWLVVEPVSPRGGPAGELVVAADFAAQAGVGDFVFCVDKREAAHAMPDPFAPVDAAVVGIVDAVDREASP